MLSRRQIQIIELLEHKKRVTGAEIAEKVRISKRTAIRDISVINHTLKDVAAIENDGHGYYLSIYNKEGFYQIFESSGLDDEVILLELVRNDYVTLEQLSEILFQSKPVLAENILQLRKKYGNRLLIRSKPNHGHYLDESFFKRFILLANIIEQNPAYFCLKLSINIAHYTKMVQVIREHLKELSFAYIHSAHLTSLFIAATLLTEHYQGVGQEQENSRIITLIYQESGMVAEGISVNILQQYFLRQSRRMERITTENIHHIIQMLEQEYHIQICDTEIVQLLAEHLKRSLAYPQILFGNRGFLLEEMKAVYPLAFDLSIQFVQLVYEKYQIELYDIDLIGLYFSSAMTRKPKKSDTIILFSNQYAVANINKLMIEQKLPDIAVIIVHGKSELMEALKSENSTLLINNQDLLIEADIVKYHHMMDVKQIVGPQDLVTIEETIKNINIQSKIDCYFPQKNLPDIETDHSDTWIDVVEIICKILVAKDILHPGEAERIIERERAGNNLVINHMAVPHCITAREVPFFSVFVHLTKAVLVEGEWVHNLLLSCTNSNIQEGIKVFNYLYHRLNEQDSDTVLKIKSHDEFLSILKT